MGQVYRDEFVWVLNKSAGVLSHPNPPERTGPNTLLTGPYDFERELYRLRRPGDRARQVWLVHRLDLDTSGLMLCALQQEAALALKGALYRHEVGKVYEALLLGMPREAEGEWRDRLDKTTELGRLEVRVRRGKPNAVTSYRVLRSFPRAGVTLVRLAPKTGRSHQLRVQAASRRLPIAGDARHGDFRANRFLAERVGVKRLFLHARQLEFLHPESGRHMSFTQELDTRLAESLERLEELRQPVPRRR